MDLSRDDRRLRHPIGARRHHNLGPPRIVEPPALGPRHVRPGGSEDRSFKAVELDGLM
ncbi:hypothetical protein [Sorangium sp. So ce1335]|uniref:hypothetical protein n=1 Tax=Sorangium sp. So ce1335 TaxID=3133335 RepID=UPI003F6022BF